MSFTRPTLAELIDREQADFESRLPGADARLPMSNLNVMARVHAGALHGLYGFQDWISRQIPFDTADYDILVRWASIWEIAPKPNSFAVGNLVFTGNDETPIDEGTEVQRADGVAYVTTAAAVVTGTTATVPAVAKVAGTGGNAEAGTKLKVVSTIGGVATDLVVGVGGMTGGADTESPAALLARFLALIRQAPHGGAAHDYVAWALEVPGVTRAWVKPGWAGGGTVGIMFMCDDDGGDGDGIPSAEKVAEVQAYIDARRPVTAEVVVFAPTPKPIAPAILGLKPSTDAVKAAVVAELKDLLRREAEPGGVILASHIREAISLAAGETDHTLTSPTGNFIPAAHQIATLGVLSWS